MILNLVAKIIFSRPLNGKLQNEVITNKIWFAFYKIKLEILMSIELENMYYDYWWTWRSLVKCDRRMVQYFILHSDWSGMVLGQGAFGRVIKAEAIGILEHEDVTVVAVKMVKGNVFCLKLRKNGELGPRHRRKFITCNYLLD